MPTLSFGRIGEVIYVVHNARSPADDEWDAYLALCEQEKRSRPDAKVFLGLTITDGGAPNAAQRNRFRTILEGMNVRASVLTDSFTVRGVVTLMGMFVKNIEVYSGDDWRKAARNLDLPEANDVLLRDTLAAASAPIGPVKALASMVAWKP